jgi:hypothetical protein
MSNPSTQGWKLILLYNIRPNVHQEYFQFMIGRYVPAVQAMGLEMTDAYHTAYGAYPSRLVIFVARSRAVLDALLESDVWEDLNEELSTYVVDFRHKVVPYREEFQF